MVQMTSSWGWCALTLRRNVCAEQRAAELEEVATQAELAAIQAELAAMR